MNYKLILMEKSRIGLVYFHNKLINIVMEHNLYRINDIYLGKISTILPGLEAAFVTLNPLAKNGFISFEQSKQIYVRQNTIKLNKNIIVQVIREPISNKGPSVSSEISLIGKYMILFPFSESVNIIKKSHMETDKEYLRAIGMLLINPKQIGISIKSEVIFANINFIVKEVKILKLRWKKILEKSLITSKPSLISNRKSFLDKVLEDHSGINFEFIAVDSYEIARKMKTSLAKIKRFTHKNYTIIEFHNTQLDLIRYYLIDILFTEIMKPRVNLSKGGYIIIEKTEALTTIDVNSGSFTTLHNSRQTSLWVNCSAAHEIIKQIRLRNIGGIIIIDFIDSSSQMDQIKLLQYLNKLARKYYGKCNITQMSELGLVEMTRSRYGQSIYDAFSKKCNTCSGLGYTIINLSNLENNYFDLIFTNISSFSKNIYNKIQSIYI